MRLYLNYLKNMKLNKYYVVTVFLVFSLFCISCTKTESLGENNVKDTQAEETEVKEMETSVNMDDVEGWEYKKENFRCFYGKWVVTDKCYGPSSLRETEHAGGILELGPDSLHYYNDDIWERR